MKSKIWLSILGSLSLLLAVGLAIIAIFPDLNHGRLTASSWFLWLAIIFLRGSKDRLWPVEKEADPTRRAWMRLPLNILLALLPGVSLLWFSLFAPNTPSLTQGGLDVCTLQTGLCLSGPRAVIIWAVLFIGIGLLGIWLIWPGRGQKPDPD